MASRQTSVDFLVEQMAAPGTVAALKLFGEYGVDCDGKLVPLICGDQLFVKPPPEGRAYADDLDEAAPHPCARRCLFVTGDRLDDSENLAALVRITTAALRAPTVKKPQRYSSAMMAETSVSAIIRMANENTP